MLDKHVLVIQTVNFITRDEGGERMRIIALLCALLLLISVIGCSGTNNSLSSDDNTEQVIQKPPTPGDPLDSNDGQEGDPLDSNDGHG